MNRTYPTWHDLEKAAMIGNRDAVLRLVSALRCYRQLVDTLTEQEKARVSDELTEVEEANLS